MTNPARRQVVRLPRQQRIAEIMWAARAVFTENGYEESLLSDIAKRANIVEGSIYRYFENKHDLLVKVIEDWYETMLSDYDQQLSGISGTRNRLRFMVWRHLMTMHEEPALCHLTLQMIRSGPDYNTTKVRELNRKYTRRTVDIVQEGVNAGELRGDVSLRLVRDLIYGCAEHRTWAYLRGEGDFDPNHSADAIVDLILRALENGSARLKDPDRQGLTRRLEQAVARLETLSPN